MTDESKTHDVTEQVKLNGHQMVVDLTSTIKDLALDSYAIRFVFNVKGGAQVFATKNFVYGAKLGPVKATVEKHTRRTLALKATAGFEGAADLQPENVFAILQRGDERPYQINGMFDA